MPTPQRTPSKTTNSQSLYKKELSKAQDFITFMTSPSPPKSRSGSPSKRGVGNRPARAHSDNDLQITCTNQTNAKKGVSPKEEEEEEVVPFLAYNTKRRVGVWTDLEYASPINTTAKSTKNFSAKSKATTPANKQKPKRRGISPNTHGRAVAQSLSSPYVPSILSPPPSTKEGTAKNVPMKKEQRSTAELALIVAHKRRREGDDGKGSPRKQRGPHSPLRRQKMTASASKVTDVEMATVKTQNSTSEEGTTAPSMKSITTRGRRSCPPKFYHEEMTNYDRDSPSRLDSPSYGLLPVKKAEKIKEASTSQTKTIKDSQPPEVKKTTPKVEVTSKTDKNTTSNPNKKRRRSRGRKHVSVGFSSLVNVQDLEKSLLLPSATNSTKNIPDATVSDDSTTTKQKKSKKKTILSNKELKEMMEKERKASVERAKKAAAKREAAKLAKMEDGGVKVEDKVQAQFQSEKKDSDPSKKENASLQSEDNLIVKLLTDSPSKVDGNESSGIPASEKDLLVAREIGKYTSSDNTAAIKGKNGSTLGSKELEAPTTTSSSSKKRSPESPSRAKRQSPSSLETDVGEAYSGMPSGEKALVVHEAHKHDSSDSTAEMKEKKRSSGKTKVFPVQKLDEKAQPSLKKGKVGTSAKSSVKSSLDKNSTANQNNISGSNKETTAKKAAIEPTNSKATSTITSPKTKSSESPRRARRQAQSSLEKVQKQFTSSPESPGRAKRQTASSLEMIPSPESPLRAKSLLSALHEDDADFKSDELPKEKTAKKVDLVNNSNSIERDNPPESMETENNSATLESPTESNKAEVSQQTASEHTTEGDRDEMRRNPTENSAKDLVPRASNSSSEKSNVDKTSDASLNPSDTMVEEHDKQCSDENGKVDTTIPASQSPASFLPTAAVRSDSTSSEPERTQETVDSTNVLNASVALVDVQPRMQQDHNTVDSPAIQDSTNVRDASEPSNNVALVDIGPRVQQRQSALDAQHFLGNQYPLSVNHGPIDNSQHEFQMLAERQYREKLATAYRNSMGFRADNERMLDIQNRIFGIDARIASGQFHSPIHYEQSVSRTYHSEIISSKKRRYRPPHHFDALDEYDAVDNHYFSQRRRDKRRSSGSKRREHDEPHRKLQRRDTHRSRYYDEESLEHSELEFLHSSPRSSSRKGRKKNKHRKRDYNSSESSDSELESPQISRERLKKRSNSRHTQKREPSDGSDLDIKQSRSGQRKGSTEKQKLRREREEDSFGNSETESDEPRHSSHRRSSQVEKRKAEHHEVESIAKPKKSPSSRKKLNRQQSPRRAKASQTSVLESVSPARKYHNRLESPRRAKLSQPSVLEDVEGDPVIRNKSPLKSTDGIDTNNDKPNQNTPASSNIDQNNSHDVKEPPKTETDATKGDQSYWLAGDSESDWDFDGPMILPPPPM